MPSSFLNDLVANGFAKLSGLRISGTLPLQQDLVNEGLRELLQSAANPQPRKESAVPVSDLLKLVRNVQVRADPGVIHVDFEIGV